MRQTRERELKLTPGPRFELPDLDTSSNGTRRFTSTYYDTDDLRLARAAVTLRRRVENGKSVWQLKLPLDSSRREVELPGGPRLPRKLQELLTALVRERTLAPVASLRTRRTWSQVEREGSLAEIALDSVAVMEARRVKARFEELEVELLQGDESLLDALANRLRQAGAGDGDGRPKVFQALGVDPGSAARPARDAPPLEHLKAMIGRQIAAMLSHDPGTRLAGEPEDLHQLRVATRRLRAVLRAGRPLVDPAWAESLRAELSWLGSALGPVRDLDVLLAHLREEVAGLDDEDRFAAERLLQTLEAERSEAREAMLEALESERYLRLLDALEDAARAPLARKTGLSLEKIAAAEFRRLRKAFTALGPDPSDDELHAVRIKAKRARYAAELAEVARGRKAARFIARAKRFQDVVGEHQDALVAEERIRTLLGSVRGTRVAFAGGLLVERQRARRRAARESVPGAWKKLERSGARAWS